MDYPIQLIPSESLPDAAVPMMPHELCWIEKKFYDQITKALERDKDALLEIVRAIADDGVSKIEFHAHRKPIDIVTKWLV